MVIPDGVIELHWKGHVLGFGNLEGNARLVAYTNGFGVGAVEIV